MLLQGRSVLVTGASRGIGRAVALACARAGADVARYMTGSAVLVDGGAFVNLQ